jgi:hypothetical protein
MILEMKKFGLILNSRPAGREAVLRVKQIINGTSDDTLVFDFDGVDVLTPSYADELFTGIKTFYLKKAIEIIGYKGNLVVEDVLKKLEIIK